MAKDEEVDQSARQAYRSIQDEHSRSGMASLIALVMAVACGILTYHYLSQNPLHITLAALAGGGIGGTLGYRFAWVFHAALVIGFVYYVVQLFVTQAS